MKKFICAILPIIIVLSALTAFTASAADAPKADLLDLSFKSDGTWTESAKNAQFAPVCGEDVEVNRVIANAVVTLDGKYYNIPSLQVDGLGDEYFAIDFRKYVEGDEATKAAFLNMLIDGYTLECTFQSSIIEMAHKAIFSSTQAGGIGLYYTEGKDENAGKMFFEMSHRATDAWYNCYGYGTGTPDTDKLYNVIVSYEKYAAAKADGSIGEIVMYVNGVKSNTLYPISDLMQGSTTFTFGLGVDVGSNGALTDAKNLGIYICQAKLYTAPITEEQAKAEFSAVKASLGAAYATADDAKKQTNAITTAAVTTTTTVTTTTKAASTTQAIAASTAAVTTAKATTAAPTAAPATGSAVYMTVSAAFMALAAAVVLAKKKKD